MLQDYYGIMLAILGLLTIEEISICNQPLDDSIFL